MKNNIISQRGGKVLYLSDTYQSSMHDKAICDYEGQAFPHGSTLWQDTGY